MRIQRRVDHLLLITIRLIVDALPLLVLDHLFLFGQHGFGDRVDKPAEFVGFGPQHFFQRIGRHSLEIVGAIATRGTIGSRATDARTHRVETTPAEVFRFQKQQMFEQMGKPRAAR